MGFANALQEAVGSEARGLEEKGESAETAKLNKAFGKAGFGGGEPKQTFLGRTVGKYEMREFDSFKKVVQVVNRVLKANGLAPAVAWPSDLQDRRDVSRGVGKGIGVYISRRGNRYSVMAGGGTQESDNVDLDVLFTGAAEELDEGRAKKPVIDQMRQIVKEKTARKIQGKMVDLWTASHVVQVYDALKPENQKKLMAMPLLQMIGVVWKLVDAATS